MSDDKPQKSLTLLIAESEAFQAGEGRCFTQVALSRSKIRYARGGAELNADLNQKSTPDLILMDQGLLRGSYNALKVIKGNDKFRSIPIVVLVAPGDPIGLDEAYSAGASSCVVRPAHTHELEKLLVDLEHYWFEVVKLPSRPGF